MQVSKIISDTFRLLTFRITREEMFSFTRGHLIFGLACTWLVGMGRYWDDLGASLPQHLPEFPTKSRNANGSERVLVRIGALLAIENRKSQI